MRLLLSLPTLLLAAASAAAEAELPPAACAGQPPIDVHALAASRIEVVDDAGTPQVVLDGDAQFAADISGSIGFESVHLDAVTVSNEAVNGASLRCDEQTFAFGTMYAHAAGGTCMCSRGIWVNALSPLRPCLVAYDMPDKLAEGVATRQAVSVLPGGPSAAQLSLVPTYTAAVAASCDAVDANGFFKVYGDVCTYFSTTKTTLVEARWQCMAAGGKLDAPGAEAISTLSYASALRFTDGDANAEEDAGIWLGMDEDTRFSNPPALVTTFSKATGQTTNPYVCQYAEQLNANADVTRFDGRCSSLQHPFCTFGKVTPPSTGRGRVVLSAVGSAAMYVSPDGGADFSGGHNFQAVANPPTIPNASTKPMVAISHDTIVAVGDDYVVTSKDDFATEGSLVSDAESANDVGQGQFERVSFDPLNPNVVAFVRGNTASTPTARLSIDGGETFRRVPKATSNQNEMNNIIVRGETMVIAKNSGHLTRHTGYGVQSGVQIDREDIGFANVNNFLLCASKSGDRMIAAQGATPKLTASDDYGATWALIPTDDANDIATVHGAVAGSSDIYRCDFGSTSDIVVFFDDAGHCFRSTDSGISWTHVAVPALASINNVQISTNGVGYACGDNGHLLRTVDDGASWELINVDASLSLCSVW